METGSGNRARRGILSVAAAAFAVLAIQVVNALPKDQPARQFKLDVEGRSGGPVGGLSAATPILQCALVHWVPGSVAVLATSWQPVAAEEPLEIGLDFITPNRPQSHAASVPANSRPLPSDFGELAVSLKIEARYLGERDGVHGLHVRDCHGERYSYYRGSGGGGSWHPPEDDLLLRTAEPTLWFFPAESTAVFFRIAPFADARRFDSGSRGAWLQSFVEHAESDIVPVRGHGFRTIIDPEDEFRRGVNHRNRFAPVRYGSALELLYAGFALDDVAAVARAVELLRVDDRLSRVQAFARSGPSREFLDEHYDQPRDELALALVHSVPPKMEKGLFIARALKMLGVTESDVLAADLASYLKQHVRYDQLRRFAYAHEECGGSEVVREEYRGVWHAVIADLGWPWGSVLHSWWRVVAWMLWVPIAALLFVLLVRRKAVELPVRYPPTAGALILLALLSFVVPGFRALLVPIWWGLALSYLRRPGSHGVGVRALAWCTLTLATIDGLTQLRWFFAHEVVAAAVPQALLFCWCLLGLRIVQEGRWHYPERFVHFLMALLGLRVLRLFEIRPNVCMTLLVVGGALALFVVFLAGGRDERVLRARRAASATPSP